MEPTDVTVMKNDNKKIQVGNEQEMAQSERNPAPLTEGWEKTKRHLGTYTKKTHRKLSEQLFPNRRPISLPN